MKFIDMVKNGTASMDDFHDAVDAWHKSSSTDPVEDFLGITKEDYFTLLKHPEYLKKLAEQYEIASSFGGKIKSKYKVILTKK